ncbi:MAG TPA: energy transducer TonB [Candidatus Eisenbacteria bacterium]
MTALASGNLFGSPFGASELKARARSHLRRGLFLSGLFHLALLAALMPLWRNGGSDAVLRAIPGDVRILPPPPLIPLPPIDAPPTPTGGRDDGRIVPVDQEITPDRPVLPRTPFDAGPTREPGSGSGPAPAEGLTRVVPSGDAPESVYRYAEEPPVPVFAPEPRYPDWAKEAGVSGRVELDVLVGSDGNVRQIVTRSGVHGLDEAARNAVARWRFRPAKANGKPVATWVTIPILFRF